MFVQVEVERHLVAVERPRAELEQAGLLIEREIRHVDRARALRESKTSGNQLSSGHTANNVFIASHSNRQVQTLAKINAFCMGIS